MGAAVQAAVKRFLMSPLSQLTSIGGIALVATSRLGREGKCPPLNETLTVTAAAAKTQGMDNNRCMCSTCSYT